MMERFVKVINFFKHVAVLMIKTGRVYYTLAVAQQMLENPQAAEEAYLKINYEQLRIRNFKCKVVILYM